MRAVTILWGTFQVCAPWCRMHCCCVVRAAGSYATTAIFFALPLAAPLCTHLPLVSLPRSPYGLSPPLGPRCHCGPRRLRVLAREQWCRRGGGRAGAGAGTEVEGEWREECRSAVEEPSVETPQAQAAHRIATHAPPRVPALIGSAPPAVRRSPPLPRSPCAHAVSWSVAVCCMCWQVTASRTERRR